MQIDHVTREDFAELKGLMEQIIETLRGKAAENGDKQWLRSAEVRRLLGISPGTLQNLRINGSLPFRKVGGTMYYKLSDMHRLMEGEGGNDGA